MGSFESALLVWIVIVARMDLGMAFHNIAS